MTYQGFIDQDFLEHRARMAKACTDALDDIDAKLRFYEKAGRLKLWQMNDRKRLIEIRREINKTLAELQYLIEPDVADDDVFGYQERWAEYRYHPALITGRFRSTAASTLDSWHLAQKFSSRPLLNGAFINEAPPIARVSAVNTANFYLDATIEQHVARPMPMLS